MGRPLAGLALVLTVSVLLASCATDMGGPEGRDGPPGRGRGGPGMGQPPSRFDGGWKAYDLNGDGRVTRAEFSAVRNLCFVRVDGNGDGLLTRAEIQRLREGQPAAPGDPAAARPGRESEGDITREEYDRAGDSLWQFLDTNGDGVIAGMELTALSAALSRDLCQPSGGPGSPERGSFGPPSGPGPGGRR